MGLNVSGQFNTSGIDKSVLKEVSQEILKRAAEKNSQYNTTSSTSNILKSQNLGLDLYKGNVDTTTAKQVATNNLQVQLNSEVMSSIKYLNTQAAQTTQKNVEGKMTIATNEEANTAKVAEQGVKFNSIISFSTDKDKNNSNTPYRGELLYNNEKTVDAEDTMKNIFNTVF